MNEPQAPPGARWDTPGWAETDLGDSHEVAALKAALESARRRGDVLLGLSKECEEELEKERQIVAGLQYGHHWQIKELMGNQLRAFFFGIGGGLLLALAVYGGLAWYGYV